MDIGVWLRGLGLERYEDAFQQSEIDAEILPDLTDADLRELGIPLGPRKKLLKAIAGTRDRSADAAPAEIRELINEDGFLRLLPHRHDMDGFFAVRMIRGDSWTLG